MNGESVAEDIANAITTWESYDWRDDDLWESFQDDFKGYTEDDFRLVNNNEIRRLRNFLRRRGVWIEKSRTTIAKSLFNALQEEKPTQWTDAEIQEYLLTEGAFDSHRINYRLRKTPITLSSGIISPSIPPIIKPTTPSARAPSTSLSVPPTPPDKALVRTSSALPTPAPVNNSTILPSKTTYAPQPTPLTGTEPAPTVMTSSIGHAAHASMVDSPPARISTSTNHAFLVDPTPAIYPTQQSGTRARPAIHTQISGIGPTPVVHTQPSSTGPPHAVLIHPSTINPPAAITPTSTNHASLVDRPPAIIPTSTCPRKELSNLAETYTNEKIYSSWNNSFILQLANPRKDALNNSLNHFRMSSTGTQGSC